MTSPEGLFDLAGIDLSDVYSPEYTAHMERLRHEAAYILARIAVTHLFASGTADHDPDAPVPEGVRARQPFFFRKRLLDYLDDRGELLRDGSDGATLRPSQALLARAGQSEEEYFGAGYDSPTLSGMKHIESIADGVLEGRDGLELLEERIGAEETWRTWQFLMTDAAPKRACNALVARALDQRLRAGEPTVVFEGGAGLGATLREALRIEGFRERAKNIAEYGFTDISRPLMNRAKEDLAEAAPELLEALRFDRVDLDVIDEYDDLPYLRDGAADVVIFESVLHDVENLHQVLMSCHRMLKPGGWLAFTVGSRTRPGTFFPCEFLQSTLHSYYRAELDPPRRTNVGYLSLEEWTRSLHDAGFPDFRVFPDPTDRERWPYGGIVARRPAD